MVDRVIETAPAVREEDGVTIIPVVEEQLVVTKRLVLKEEIHLRKVRTTTRATEDVTVRKQRAEVVRLDADGREFVRDAQPQRPEPPRSGLRFLKDW